jgi:hypothetical protein
MHGMMLAIEAGRIMAIDVVQLANGFDRTFAACRRTPQPGTRPSYPIALSQ